MPQSAQEPMGKVELLLMQTNIRFSLLVRQLERSMENLINVIIELNQTFLDEDKAFRVAGDELKFDRFTNQDKQVYVDTRVEIIPKKEKSPEQESKDVLALYEKIVENDPPNEQDPQSVYHWEKKKAELQKLLLERLGLEEYEDILIKDPEEPQQGKVEPEEQMPLEQTPPGMEQMLPEGMPQGGMMDPAMPPMMQTTPEKEPIIPLEEGGMTPQATTSMTQPSEGLVQRLRNKIGI